MIHSRDKLIQIGIGNNLIPKWGYGLQEESVGLLGVRIDENLDQKIHIKQVEKRVKGNQQH